jgi:hypothetical protein
MVPQSIKYIEDKPNYIFISFFHKREQAVYMLVNGANGLVKQVFYRKKNRFESSKKLKHFIDKHDYHFSKNTKVFEFSYKNFPQELEKLLSIVK